MANSKTPGVSKDTQAAIKAALDADMPQSSPMDTLRTPGSPTLTARLPPVFTEGPRNGSVEVDYLAINDIVLAVPINNITISKQSQNYEWATLRTLYTRKVKSGYGNVSIKITLTFSGANEIGAYLKPLIAGLRATPFCVCHSEYLNKMLRGTEVILDDQEEQKYKLFEPLALALDTVNISTVPKQPDTLVAEFMFQWFNYHPYMSRWIYKIGTAFQSAGTVFQSDLWKAFYSIFESQDSFLEWPHTDNSEAAKTYLYCREFLAQPGFDQNANKAVRELIDLMKHKPKEIQGLLKEFQQNKQIEWTDQNIWDVFWLKTGKEALAKGADVSEEVRKRLNAADVPTNAVTNAVEQSGLGSILRQWTPQSQQGTGSNWEKETADAAKKLDQFDEEMRKGQAVQTRMGSELAPADGEYPTERKSQFTKLDSISLEFNDASAANAKHPGLGSVDVYGRKRRIELSAETDIIIEAISLTISHNLTSIPMMNYRYPTLQYTGGCSVNVTMSLNCSTEAAARFNRFYDTIETTALKFRMVPQGFQNIVIQNDFLNYFKFDEFITEGIQTQTIEGMPGRSNIIVEFTHPGVNSTDNTGNVEDLHQEKVYTQDQIRVLILSRLDDKIRRKGPQDPDNRPTEASYYDMKPDMNVNDPKQKALASLVEKYCTIYNKMLSDTWRILFKKGAWVDELKGTGILKDESLFVNPFTSAENFMADVAAVFDKMGNLDNVYKGLTDPKPSATDQRIAAAKAANQQIIQDVATATAAGHAIQEGTLSGDMDVQMYIYFMDLEAVDPQWGWLPSIVSAQYAVQDRNNSLMEIDPSDVKVTNTNASMRQGWLSDKNFANHVEKNFPNAKGDAQYYRDILQRNDDIFKKIFDYLRRYQNEITALADEIYQKHLLLPEFKDLFTFVKSTGLHKGLPTYYDFLEQIDGAKSLINKRLPGSSTNRWDYEPDVYLFNPAWDGGVANLENGAIFDTRVLDVAKQMSLQSAKNAKEQVHNFFQQNYYKTLQKVRDSNEDKTKFGKPATSLEKNSHEIDEDLSYIKTKRTGTPSTVASPPDPYRHNLFSEQDTTNALQSYKLMKELSIDSGIKATINAAGIHEAMEGNYTITNTTSFANYIGKANVGKTGPAPTPSRPPAPVPTPAQPPPQPSPQADTTGLVDSNTKEGKDAIRAAFPRNKIINMIRDEAEKKGVSAQFAMNVVLIESPGLDTCATNPSGATGLFQALPAWCHDNHLALNKRMIPSASIPAGIGSLVGKNSSSEDARIKAYVQHNQGATGQAEIYQVQARKGHLNKERRKNILGQNIAAINRALQANPKLDEYTLVEMFMDWATSAVRRTWNQAATILAKTPRDGSPQPQEPQQPKQQVEQKRAPQTTEQVTSGDVCPFDLCYNEFQKELYEGQATGLHRAYPTFKLYFIADEANRKRLGFDEFFGYQAVQSIRIVRDRHIAADLCELQLTNVSGFLTNRKFTQTPDTGVYARDVNGKIAQKNFKDPTARNTVRENPIASLLLREGTHFSVYMGYSNDSTKLDLVFTGVITEIEVSGSDDLIRILGQSYGIELVQDIKGMKPEVLSSHGFSNWDFWGFFTEASTGKILEEMITQDEVVHFGRWSANDTYTTTDRDLLTNKYHWVKKPADDNIFPPLAKAEYKDLGDDLIFSEMRYIIYHTTIWDVFQEMTLRHPNYIAAAVPFQALATDRMTMFFGLPHHLYFHRDPTWSEDNQAETIRTEAYDATQKAIDNKTGMNLQQENEWRRKQHWEERKTPAINPDNYNQSLDRNSISMTSPEYRHAAENNELQEAVAKDKAVRALTNKRLQFAQKCGYIKPFRSYHLLTSKFHIVANGIQANARDVANTIVVRYNSKSVSKGYIVENVQNGELAVSEGDDEKVVKLDVALPPEEMRTQTVGFLNVTGKNMAKRYGLGMLLRNTKNVYRGELVVLGNPKIKPHDICYVLDEYNDMVGPIEVDRVIHIFSNEQGFLTEIKPAMVAQVGEWSLLHTIQAMGIVMEGGSKWLFNDGKSAVLPAGGSGGVSAASRLTGRLFDFFGGFVSDTVINNTQLGYPLVLAPMQYHGRPFAGGTPTSKLPKAPWKNMFGYWSPLAQDGWDMWWEDKKDEVLKGMGSIFMQNEEGTFWNHFNTMDVESTQ